MIVHRGSKFKVMSHSGKTMGTYDTKEAAAHRLRQVEMFKHMKMAKGVHRVDKLKR